MATKKSSPNIKKAPEVVLHQAEDRSIPFLEPALFLLIAFVSLLLLYLSQSGPEAVPFVIVGILGAFMGAFVNNVAWGIVNGGSFLKEASRCPSCDRVLDITEIIPVLSWLLLRGKCRRCQTRIPFRYFLVEVLMAALFVLLYFTFGLTPQMLAYAALFCVLCGVVLVDFATLTIPNSFIVAGIAIWFVSAWFIEIPYVSFSFGGAFTGVLGQDFVAIALNGLIGAFLLSGFMLLFSALFEKITGTVSLGGGDIKLLFMVSLFLGPFGSLLNLLLACLIGVLISFFWFRLTPRTTSLDVKADEEYASRVFPFGPAIAFSTVLTIFVGLDLISWYLGFF